MLDGNEKRAHDAVQGIVDDLCGRRGFRQAWDDVDDDIAREIRETWAAIIVKALLTTGDKA